MHAYCRYTTARFIVSLELARRTASLFPPQRPIYPYKGQESWANPTYVLQGIPFVLLGNLGAETPVNMKSFMFTPMHAYRRYTTARIDAIL